MYPTSSEPIIEDKVFSYFSLPGTHECGDVAAKADACDFMVFKDGTARIMLKDTFEIHRYERQNNDIIIYLND